MAYAMGIGWRRVVGAVRFRLEVRPCLLLLRRKKSDGNRRFIAGPVVSTYAKTASGLRAEILEEEGGA